MLKYGYCVKMENLSNIFLSESQEVATVSMQASQVFRIKCQYFIHVDMNCYLFDQILMTHSSNSDKTERGLSLG